MHKTPEVDKALQLHQTTTTVSQHGEVRPCGFWDMHADRQTNKSTHHNTSGVD